MESISKPKSTPRDVFLHLLSIIALYASATAFLTLAFQLINLWFPDILDAGGYYAYAGARNAIRWSLASLIVIFPVYFGTARFLRKEYEAEPEKRELRVRKWLISFTLFVVALTLIGDLVSLLSHFLEGELTTRFALKVLVIAFVAAAIGSYYLWILKGRAVTPPARYAASGILAVILAGVVVGFFYAGSPAEERLRRIDMNRVNDLQMIQSEVVSYWQAKEKLPANLEALADDIRGVRIPADPETKAPYEYRATEPLSFELCATFARVSDRDENLFTPRALIYPAPYQKGESWMHSEGRTCFSHTIDPDIYRPLPR
ncbi:MAG: DUF5671 domain-containing protein [Candidatus Jorgensenbacteria bacterium]|nr:DUF5671 domain-containing protein [Candidatus Jorgensenbacteria bacterium]